MKANDNLFGRKSHFLISLYVFLFLVFVQNFDHVNKLLGDTILERKEDECVSLFNSDFPQEWEVQNSGVHSNLRDICFVDSLYGWAAGDSGTVIATTDGGITWQRIHEKVDSLEFEQIQFINRDIGYIGGSRNEQFPYYEAHYTILLKTTNGGLTWEPCDSTFDSNLSFSDMQFLDSENGWIGLNNIGQTSYADRKGVLLKTNNGGQTWTVQQEKEELLIGAVAFWNDDTGYSFWSYFFDNFDDTEVYSTSNGGSEWIQIDTIGYLIQKAKCFSVKSIWAFGLGTAWSSDGGETWNDCDGFSPAMDGLGSFITKDIEMFNANTIWLVGCIFGSHSKGMLLYTNDSGETWWCGLQISDHSIVNAISTVSSKKAWIAGKDGLIMHLKHIVTGIKEEKEGSPASFVVNQNYPNPFNASTKIEYFLPTSSHVHVEIFDILGRKIKTLVNSDKKDGWHDAIWSGRNEENESLPSGVYFYRIFSNGLVSIKKMMMVR